MKKIVFFTFLFSFLLILLTFLNYKIEVIETKIIDTEIVNKKLEKDLVFFKSEWEYINSPENISYLSKKGMQEKFGRKLQEKADYEFSFNNISFFRR